MVISLVLSFCFGVLVSKGYYRYLSHYVRRYFYNRDRDLKDRSACYMKEFIEKRGGDAFIQKCIDDDWIATRIDGCNLPVRRKWDKA